MLTATSGNDNLRAQNCLAIGGCREPELLALATLVAVHSIQIVALALDASLEYLSLLSLLALHRGKGHYEIFLNGIHAWQIRLYLIKVVMVSYRKHGSELQDSRSHANTPAQSTRQGFRSLLEAGRNFCACSSLKHLARAACEKHTSIEVALAEL